MSLLFRSASTRSLGPDLWGSGGDVPMVGGSMKAALRLIPVYAAVGQLSDSVATTPWHAYQDRGAGRERMPSQPALIASPSTVGDKVTWLHQCVASLLLRGNAYGLHESYEGGGGYPTKIRWLNPEHMQVDESGYFPRYSYLGTEIPADMLTHIPAFVLPGSVEGVSPVGLFRMQITKGLSAESFAAAFFDRGVAPAGILRNSKKTIDSNEGEVAKRRFKAAVAGRDIFVTGNDWEWATLTLPTQDALFLEAIKATATQIAALYRLPAEDIGGETGSSMTYQTLEMNELMRIRRAVMPWTARVESAINRLLPSPQYVRFNLDVTARADLKTRIDAEKVALEAGIYTLDEVRALEDRAPLTAEDIALWQQLYKRPTVMPQPGREETPR